MTNPESPTLNVIKHHLTMGSPAFGSPIKRMRTPLLKLLHPLRLVFGVLPLAATYLSSAAELAQSAAPFLATYADLAVPFRSSQIYFRHALQGLEPTLDQDEQPTESRTAFLGNPLRSGVV